MRPDYSMKRSRNRGRSNKPHYQNSNPNRTLESNGPDVKIRGNAQHIYEKYQQLARDASSSGDRVMAESYLQHAEHYFRVLLATQPQGQPYNPNQPGQQQQQQQQPYQQHSPRQDGQRQDVQSQGGNNGHSQHQQGQQQNSGGPQQQRQPVPNDQGGTFQGLPGPAFIGEETDEPETDESSEIRS